MLRVALGVGSAERHFSSSVALAYGAHTLQAMRRHGREHGFGARGRGLGAANALPSSPLPDGVKVQGAKSVVESRPLDDLVASQSGRLVGRQMWRSEGRQRQGWG